MIFLGLDPGIQRLGYCVLKAQGSRIEILTLGTWHLVSHSVRPSIEVRLEKIYTQLSGLLQNYPPDVVGLEKAVTFKNVASAHTLSEARGVMRLALQMHRKNVEQPLRVWELSPTAIKRLATGFGGADKQGIFKAMTLRMPDLAQSLQKVPEEKYTHDALDALAIAWSALVEERTQRRLEAGRVKRPALKMKEGNA